MNPYLAFGLAMCAVLFLALAGTSYLAVYFNRKAKEDLEAALTPLAEVIEGEIDLEEASLSGRYRGHLTSAKVSTLPGGMGRVFLISLIDGAGGDPWQWTLTRSKEPGGDPAGAFGDEPGPDGLWEAAGSGLEAMITDPSLIEAWFRVAYDPAAGYVQLTRPMRNRRDIPSAGSFRHLLDALYAIAASNRAAQGPRPA
ncbi:hypothetical protein BH23CHL4_BH23CHL4_03050 [soil metagenome]